MVRTKRYEKAAAEPIGVITEAERKAVKAAQDARVVRGDLDAKWLRDGKTFDQFPSFWPHSQLGQALRNALYLL